MRYTSRTWLAMITTAAVTFTVIAAVAVLPGLFRGGGSGAAAGPAATDGPTPPSGPPSGEPSGPPLPWPSGGIPVMATDAPLNTAARLTEVLTGRANVILSGTTFAPIPGVYSLRALKAFEVIPSQGGFKAWAEIQGAAGVARFFLSVNGEPAHEMGKPALVEHACEDRNAGMACQAREGPDHELIVVEQQPPTAFLVTVVRVDGTSMWAEVRLTAAGSHPTLPCQPEQIVQLLLSPGLSIFS